MATSAAARGLLEMRCGDTQHFNAARRRDFIRDRATLPREVFRLKLGDSGQRGPAERGMSLIKTWAPHFQSGIRMRGRAYQAAGRVKRLPTSEGELVRAE